MPTLHVLLMQLPVPNNPATNVPLAAGYLKAYAQARGLLDHVQIDILPRELADTAGDALLADAITAQRPDLLGISLYTWNSERSLGLAARLKARLPGLIVVVGGPEVQPDNHWLLHHPAVDLAVIGEGEQTFAELLELLASNTARPGAVLEYLPALPGLPAISGLAFRNRAGEVVVTPERAALSDLAPLPSPYLLGYLAPGPIMMIEISRWCPYACAFCLYGRNMGAKLGSRYFPLERVLAELRWGRDHGARQIHFVEANLNLVPLFRPLMRALADMNADGALALYAELRGEHLDNDVVDALCRAGLRVAEVGLQTANPLALSVAQRRTNLRTWAAGTRRLQARGVEIYLDVILGLPADDATGIASTIEFIERENLGPYDVFTLQVLPGTATRRQAAEYALVYQDRPPYYILGTDRLSYAELRRLRRVLKRGAGLDPDEIEGCPPPREHALAGAPGHAAQPVCYSHIWLVDADQAGWLAAAEQSNRLAHHVDVVARWADAGRLAGWLAAAIDSNPSTLFDCYLLADFAPEPALVAGWGAALPYHPGYLDRVAVYRRAEPGPGHARASLRLWLVLPWAVQADPADYTGVAAIIWAYDLASGEAPPLGAWAAAGGAGVWPRGCSAEQVAGWRTATGMRLWG